MADELPTTERLARALEEAHAPAEMVANARAGVYDDYKSDYPMPILRLVEHARAAGLPNIANRAINGEFDATKAEFDAWAASPEGQQAFRDKFGTPRN